MRIKARMKQEAMLVKETRKAPLRNHVAFWKALKMSNIADRRGAEGTYAAPFPECENAHKHEDVRKRDREHAEDDNDGEDTLTAPIRQGVSDKPTHLCIEHSVRTVLAGQKKTRSRRTVVPNNHACWDKVPVEQERVFADGGRSAPDASYLFSERQDVVEEDHDEARNCTCTTESAQAIRRERKAAHG
jgi:hypothetical protein